MACNRTLSVLAAISCALMLVACAPGPIAHPPELRRQTTFDSVTDSAVIARDQAGWIALDLLLARNGARHGDRLVVDADRETVAGLRNRYAVTGVRVLQAPGVPPVPADQPYRATFARLVVTSPACGDWSRDPEDGHDNQPDPNFGCSQDANLARMVADPHDLIAGREPDDGYQTDADTFAVRAYRQHNIDWVFGTSGSESGGGSAD